MNKEIRATPDPTKSEAEQLREALLVMLDCYVGLVESGDAGFWDPGTEPEVQLARATLARTGRQSQAAMLALTIPGQPLSVNALYARARGRGGDRYLTPEGKQYKQLAGLLARRAWMEAGRLTLASPVGVRLRFFFRTLAADVDGPLKPVLDSLQQAGILRNDNLVHELQAYKARDAANPRVEVEVWPLEEADGAQPR